MKRIEFGVHIRGSIRDKHCQLSYFAACEQLNWRLVWDCSTTFDRMVDWYHSFHEEGRLRTTDDLTAYQSELFKFPLS